MSADGEKWLGIGRKGWKRVQWAIGTYNAFGVFYALDGGRWFAAALSLAGLFAVAHWRLPYAPPARKSKGEECDDKRN